MTLTLAFSSCEDDLVRPTVPAGYIAITPQQAEIAVGDSVEFTAQVQTTGGGSGPRVTWQSHDTSVATLDSTGMTYGVSPGNTTVEATTFQNGEYRSASAHVTVVPDTTGGG